MFSFPARDAASAGWSFIFFYLARFPGVWERLRREVLGVENPLSKSVLRDIKYLD